MYDLDLIIVGAGQSGLALARHAKTHSLRYLILERHNQIQGQWRDHFDSLRLFSSAQYSSLEGFAFPKPPRSYPTKAEVAQYLSDYANHFKLEVQTGTQVQHVLRAEHGFLVETSNTQFKAPAVVLAIGAYSTAFTPQIDGLHEFAGQVLHAQQYRNPQAFLEQRVLIVGGGNSAVQIAFELSSSARVFLASRRPLRFIRNPIFGQDVIFWTRDVFKLEFLSIPFRLPEPIIDTQEYQLAFQTGQMKSLPMFDHVLSDRVSWKDGRELPVDSVIFATGYRPNLTLAGDLIRFDANGFPIHRQGVLPYMKGLFLLGMHGQRNFSSATLRGTDDDARALLQDIMRCLGSGDHT